MACVKDGGTFSNIATMAQGTILCASCHVRPCSILCNMCLSAGFCCVGCMKKMETDHTKWCMHLRAVVAHLAKDELVTVGSEKRTKTQDNGPLPNKYHAPPNSKCFEMTDDYYDGVVDEGEQTGGMDTPAGKRRDTSSTTSSGCCLQWSMYIEQPKQKRVMCDPIVSCCLVVPLRELECAAAMWYRMADSIAEMHEDARKYVGLLEMVGAKEGGGVMRPEEIKHQWDMFGPLVVRRSCDMVIGRCVVGAVQSVLDGRVSVCLVDVLNVGQTIMEVVLGSPMGNGGQIVKALFMNPSSIVVHTRSADHTSNHISMYDMKSKRVTVSTVSAKGGAYIPIFKASASVALVAGCERSERPGGVVFVSEEPGAPKPYSIDRLAGVCHGLRCVGNKTFVWFGGNKDDMTAFSVDCSEHPPVVLPIFDHIQTIRDLGMMGDGQTFVMVRSPIKGGVPTLVAAHVGTMGEGVEEKTVPWSRGGFGGHFVTTHMVGDIHVVTRAGMGCIFRETSTPYTVDVFVFPKWWDLSKDATHLHHNLGQSISIQLPDVLRGKWLVRTIGKTSFAIIAQIPIDGIYWVCIIQRVSSASIGSDDMITAHNYSSVNKVLHVKALSGNPLSYLVDTQKGTSLLVPSDGSAIGGILDIGSRYLEPNSPQLLLPLISNATKDFAFSK
jgi:hypothetical protein